MLGIFLDRDGVLIADKHYLCDPKDVVVLPKIPDAIKIFRLLGSRLFLFSNQSGISRGLFTMADVEKCNSAMLEQIGCGNFFDDVCIAPEGPDDPVNYRKPSPRFINEMVKEYSLNPKKCFMLGDKLCDVMAAVNAGINPVLIREDGSLDELVKNTNCLKFRNVWAFVVFLQNQKLQAFL